ncbi:MAG: DUF2510 domain-containing protein [Acidimicrobiales bacterium]
MTDEGGRSDAGWKRDPSGRYVARYWDGTAWTEHVSTADRQPGSTRCLRCRRPPAAPLPPFRRPHPASPAGRSGPAVSS